MKKTLVIGFLLLLSWGCSKAPAPGPTIQDPFIRATTLPEYQITPGGVHIRLESGTQLSAAGEDAIDRGITDTLEKVQCAYGRSNELSSYTVAILQAEPDSNGDPAYKVPCGPGCGYEGTEYDKGGYILAAGQYIAAGTPFGNVIALPEHVGKEEHLRRVAGYEAEHVELAWFDGFKFLATQVHGPTTGHPLIPECPANPTDDPAKIPHK